jgi:Lar family restriction alleviation protein
MNDDDAIVDQFNKSPCPFCGSEDVVSLRRHVYISTGKNTESNIVKYFCHCGGCGAHGPVTGQGHRRSIELWNRRK